MVWKKTESTKSGDSVFFHSISPHVWDSVFFRTETVQRSRPPLSDLRRNYASCVQTLVQTPAVPCPCRPCHSLYCVPSQNSLPGGQAGLQEVITRLVGPRGRGARDWKNTGKKLFGRTDQTYFLISLSRALARLSVL